MERRFCLISVERPFEWAGREEYQRAERLGVRARVGDCGRPSGARGGRHGHHVVVLVVEAGLGGHTRGQQGRRFELGWRTYVPGHECLFRVCVRRVRVRVRIRVGVVVVVVV